MLLAHKRKKIVASIEGTTKKPYCCSFQARQYYAIGPMVFWFSADDSDRLNEHPKIVPENSYLQQSSLHWTSLEDCIHSQGCALLTFRARHVEADNYQTINEQFASGHNGTVYGNYHNKFSKRVAMKEELFNELMHSVHEGGAILRAEKSPSRKFTVEKPDVQQIRANYRLSQKEFASMLGISKDTLQNWEQGRRQPQGPVRVLLQVAAKHP
jgi:putative transcriptional regulator